MQEADDVTLDDVVEQPDEGEEGAQNGQEEKAVKRKRTVEDEGGAIDVSAAEAAAGALAEAAAGSVLEANGEELVVARLRGLPWSFDAVKVCDFVAAVGVTAQPEAVTMLHNAAGEAFITLESKSQETEVLKANRQQVGKRYVEVFSSSAAEKQAACDRNRATMRDDAGYRGVLRMRGLPFSTVVDEVLEFFGQSASLKRENVHLMRRSDGRASGDAYAVFDTEEAAVAALSFDKQKLGTRWVDLFQSSKGELYSLTSVGGIMLGSETLNLAQGGEGAEQTAALGEGYFVIKLRGLPWGVTIEDIVAFLAPIPVPQGGVHLMTGANGRPSGLAYVELGSEDAQKEALLKDKQSIGGRYIDIFSCSQTELQARLAGGLERGWQGGMGMGGRQNAGAADACFVKLRGLPYSADQHQIGAFFQPLLVLGMQVALNNSGQPSGFGFVQFRSAEDVATALSRSGNVMGSRYVEVFRSTRMEMEQARMHAMAMRPPHMGHHAGHHAGHHNGHHGHNGGHGGGGHGNYGGGGHGGGGHGGHGGNKGGPHGGESAYAAYQSAMQTLACRPPHGYGDPSGYGSASGYAPPSYGGAEGGHYSAAPPAGGYGSQGYAAPPGGGGGGGSGGYGGGGSYGYGGQPSGYEQWGYYAQ